MILNFLFEKTPLYFMIQSFWRDEAFSFLMAKQNIISIITTTSRDYNPPLYYFFLHFWIKFFGSNEVFLRSLSLIFFVINVYFVFLFLRNIMKINFGQSLVYFLLFILNPFLLYYAFEARMYSLLALLTTLSFYYYYLKDQKKYLIFTVLSFYTHYFFFFAFFSQIIHFYFFRKKMRSFKPRFFFISFLFFLPWLIYIAPLIIKQTVDFWIKKPDNNLFFSSLAIIFTGYEKLYRFYDQYINLLSLFFFFIILIFLIKKNLKKKDLSLFFLFLIWVIFPFFSVLLLSQIKPIFLPRYLIYTAVGFNLLLFFILSKTKKTYRLIFIILLFLFVYHFTKLEVKHKRKINVKKVITEIKLLIKKDDFLYVSDKEPSLYLLASYYFDENRVFLYRETGNKISPYIGRVLIPEKKIKYRLPRYPKKAFILENEYNYRIESSL